MREIRIHGVSGTPPEDMLGVGSADDAVRVMSYVDPKTGFYRAAEGAASTSQPPAGVTAEAYSWGSLTSSGGTFLEGLRRAGWLSLLPLALANIAYWARPGIDTGSRTRIQTAIAVRWAGLAMTMALVSSACLVGIDLVAWQCFRGGGQVCSFTATIPVVGTRLDFSAFLGFLTTPGWNDPARRVLVGALVPLAVLAGLWWLSRQTRRDYEEVGCTTTGGLGVRGVPEAPHLDGGQLILQRARMWRGSFRMGRQQALHVAAGVAVIVLFCSATLLTEVPGTDQPLRIVEELGAQWWVAVPPLAAVVVLVLAFLGSALSVGDGNDFAEVPDPGTGLGLWSRIVARAALTLAVVAFVGFAVVAFTTLTDLSISDSRQALDGIPFVGAIFVLLAAIVAGLAFASRWGAWAWLCCLVPPAFAAVAYGTRPRPASTAVELQSAALQSVLSAVTWVLIVVGVAVLLQRATATPGQAWGGAAPAVILGAGMLVALIFTAGMVGGIANLLNGKAPATDLHSTFDGSVSAGQVATDLGTEVSAEKRLTADGPVTVSGGTLCVSGDKVTVYGGSMSAERLSAEVGGAGVPVAVPDLSLTGGQLTVADGVVQVRESAVSTPSTGCPAETLPTEATPVPQGTIAVTSPIVLATQSCLEQAGRAPSCSADVVHIDVTESPQEPLVVPSMLLWFATLFPLWLIAAGVLAGLAWLRLSRRGRGDIADQVAADRLRHPAASRVDDARRVGPRFVAAYAHRFERLLALLSVLTGIVVLAGIVGSSTTTPPWYQIEWLHGLGNIGLWCTIGAGLAILWLASGVRRSASLRRQVGILWDITTFFPRVAHPFAPPCYAERVVPEITRRVREALRGGDEIVILSAHSQGSTIAVAVATRLSDADLDRVRLLTYGSQLRTWFARIFPGVLGPSVLGVAQQDDAWDFATAAPDAPARLLSPHEVPGGGWAYYPLETPPPAYSLRARLQAGDDVAHWVNLFRRTDPLGFRVFTDEETPASASVDQWQDYCVDEFDVTHDILTHSAYQASPPYARVLHSWAFPGRRP